MKGREMIGRTGTAGWARPVIAFIEHNLPGSPDGDWDHPHITAYQVGCEALAALGRAEETSRGTRPLRDPRLPHRLPRWDDICVAVLKLAAQQDLLSCRLPSGRELPAHAAWLGRRTGERLPPPNIAPAHGLGLAYAAPDVVPVLRALGLIDGEQWSAAAELVFWRVRAEEWALAINSDPRFTAAVDRATSTMPDDIRAHSDASGRLFRQHPVSHSGVSGQLRIVAA